MAEYKWKPNTPNRRVSAEVFGKELEKLADPNSSVMGVAGVDPQRVVDAAKDPSSPIHPMFDWDKDKASQSWWLHSARQFISSLLVVYAETESVPGRIERAYFSVSAAKQRAYVPTESIITHNELRRQVIKDARRELETFINKYERLIGNLSPNFIPSLHTVLDEMRDCIEALEYRANKRSIGKIDGAGDHPSA